MTFKMRYYRAKFFEDPLGNALKMEILDSIPCDGSYMSFRGFPRSPCF